MQNGTRLAAVDLGSNSFRLEIVRLDHGQFERTEYVKETIRQGAGMDADRNLSAQAMQRGWDCLARFGERLAGFEYAPGSCRRNPDPARSAQPRRLPVPRQPGPWFPDRRHFRARGSQADLPGCGQDAAVIARAPAGGRHRRSLDRADRRRRRRTREHGVVPGRQHRMVEPVFPWRPLHAARVPDGRNRGQGGARRGARRLWAATAGTWP